MVLSFSLCFSGVQNYLSCLYCDPKQKDGRGVLLLCHFYDNSYVVILVKDRKRRYNSRGTPEPGDNRQHETNHVPKLYQD
jgi:hypothetical protein